MKRYRLTGSYPPLLGAGLLLVVWEGVTRYYRVPLWLLPPPSRIVMELVQDFSSLWPHLKATLLEAAAGFLLAVALALILAFILDQVPLIQETVYPLLVVSQTVPIITIAPLLIIWLGYGLAPKVVVVILTCFFPVVVSLLQGLGGVDPDLLNLFRTMQANRWQVFRLVKLPSALPSFFAGLKISATYCLMAAVIGEWLGAQAGLGYYMVMAQKSFLTDRVFVVIVLITLLSLLFLKLVNVLERFFIPWNPGTQRNIPGSRFLRENGN